MTKGAVCLPDGIELDFSEAEDGIRLDSYKVPTGGTSVFGNHAQKRQPSERLRARRFGTVDELVEAIRLELAKP